MSVWQNLIVLAAGNLFFFLLQVWFFHWRKREEAPDELHKEVECLRNDVVALRVEVARIKGRINGKGWNQEA